ncbi:hypothetical protein HGRIS_007524 [Hohenbuehelia grisea]|uniref:Mitochondrial carrier n=1 Tax=Hohenbuehelia grisea TaxID=104357 RepID=A0ABR3J5V7_9AGAR
MASSSSSLRDMYTDSSAGWSFLPAAPQPENSTSAPAGPSYQFSTRPAHNSIFDLSPSLDLSEPSSVDAGLLLRSIVASALLQYSSSAIAMPWEVGKLLLQVQWVPRDAGEVLPELELKPEVEEDALSDDDANADSYFADPSTASARHPPVRPVDDQGYPIRRSILEEEARPEYIIPVGGADGVWNMIKRVGRFRGEGWFALWKGLLTSCTMEVLSSTLQPVIHSILISIFYPSTASLPQPSLIVPVASHLITGFLLSPLDLIRTRLIVQSFLPRHRSYSGPIDALSQILQHEGGLRGIYLHPHLLIPTILDNALRPLVSLLLPGMLTSTLSLGINQDTNPVIWGLLELTTSCIGLLVTLPFETVRRRLQVQVRGTANPIRGCVELRQVPYNGVVDAFWHILTEERSDLPVVPRVRRRRPSQAGAKRSESPEGKAQEADDEDDAGFMRHTGVGQLYRGLGMRLGASAVVFLLAMFSGVNEVDSGWAEL